MSNSSFSSNEYDPSTFIKITEAYDFSDGDEAHGGFVFTNSLGGSISDVTGTISVGSFSKSQSIYTLAGGTVDFWFSEEEMDEMRREATTGTQEIVYTLSYTFLNNTYSVVAYATFTVDESDFTKPTINSVSISPNNGSMGSAFDGLYIQGRSKASVAVTATAKYNAWISSYTVTVGSTSYTSESSSFSTGYITSSAVVPVKVTVKDSRGFTATYNQNISVIEYSNPSVVPPVSAVECFRCDEGGNPSSIGDRVWINAKRSYSRLIVDGVQKNFCLLRWRSKLDTSSTWGSWNTLIAKNSTDSDVFNGIISASLSHTSSFNIQIGVIDDTGGESYLDFDVPNADVALHLGEGGKAVGIGGYADTSNPESITMWWNTIFKEGFEINSVGMKIGSNMTDLANVPNGVTSGRYLKFCGSSGGDDNYYLLISYTGKLYVGIQINGASTITWTEK